VPICRRGSKRPAQAVLARDCSLESGQVDANQRTADLARRCGAPPVGRRTWAKEKRNGNLGL